MSSLQVRGKIFVTVPPDEERIHIFITEPERDLALAMYEEFTEALYWGSKLVGVRLTMKSAPQDVVELLVRQAWQNKAPKALLADLLAHCD